MQILALTKAIQRLSLLTNSGNILKSGGIKNGGVFLGAPNRTATNFFNKLPADDLWKGITSVSNAGRKRGRGKTVSKSKIKDLNRGQVIGVGKLNMVWPGLSAPIIRGRELVERQKLPEDPEREKKLIALRDQMGTFKFQKLSPIERGWSGSKMPGRSMGPPDPVGEETFDGFDTKCLDLRQVFHMKGTFGRTRRLSTFVVTGNGAGLAGFALGGAQDAKTALRKAKNRAGQKLMHIKLFRGHTICHDFHSTFGDTKIYCWQKPEGYGLICHRAIKSICEVVGIKNLHAKVEGAKNVNHITKAFFLGLIQQKYPSEIAEEKRLHLVEISPETHHYPNVIASPKSCRKSTEIPKDEILDYNQFSMNGKIFLKQKPKPPFYAEHYSYYLYLKKFEKIRNQNEVRKHLLAEFGEVRSFLSEKYPECKAFKRKQKNKSKKIEGNEEIEGSREEEVAAV